MDWREIDEKSLSRRLERIKRFEVGDGTLAVLKVDWTTGNLLVEHDTKNPEHRFRHYILEPFELMDDWRDSTQ